MLLLFAFSCASTTGLTPSLPPDPRWAALPAHATLRTGMILTDASISRLEQLTEEGGMSVPALEEQLFQQTGLVAGAAALQSLAGACTEAGCGAGGAGVMEGLAPGRLAPGARVLRGDRTGGEAWQLTAPRGLPAALTVEAGRFWLGSPGLADQWGPADRTDSGTDSGAAPGWLADVPAGDLWVLATDQAAMRGQVTAFVRSSGMEGGEELLAGWEARFAARPALVQAVDALALSVGLPEEPGDPARLVLRARMRGEAEALQAQRWLWARLCVAQIVYSGTARGAILGTAEIHRAGARVEVEFNDVTLPTGRSALAELLAELSAEEGR